MNIKNPLKQRGLSKHSLLTGFLMKRQSVGPPQSRRPSTEHFGEDVIPLTLSRTQTNRAPGYPGPQFYLQMSLTTIVPIWNYFISFYQINIV